MKYHAQFVNVTDTSGFFLLCRGFSTYTGTINLDAKTLEEAEEALDWLNQASESEIRQRFFVTP